MVEEITGPGYEPLGRARRARTRKTDTTDHAQGDGQPKEIDESDELPGELQTLIDRIRKGEAYRLERVHEVLEKLQRGELVTSETVRRAAERILREGL